MRQEGRLGSGLGGPVSSIVIIRWGGMVMNSTLDLGSGLMCAVCASLKYTSRQARKAGSFALARVWKTQEVTLDVGET